VAKRNSREGRSRGGDWEATTVNWPMSLTFAAGGVQFTDIISLVPVASGSGVLTVGKAVVSELDVSIQWNTIVTGGAFYFGVGIYKSIWNSLTLSWSAQDPSQPVDACRDNWLWIENRSMVLPATGAATALVMPAFSFKRRVNQTVRQGESLRLAISTSQGQAGVNFASAWARAKVSRLA